MGSGDFDLLHFLRHECGYEDSGLSTIEEMVKDIQANVEYKTSRLGSWHTGQSLRSTRYCSSSSNETFQKGENGYEATRRD